MGTRTLAQRSGAGGPAIWPSLETESHSLARCKRQMKEPKEPMRVVSHAAT